jgi:hypothetical protein
LVSPLTVNKQSEAQVGTLNFNVLNDPGLNNAVNLENDYCDVAGMLGRGIIQP